MKRRIQSIAILCMAWLFAAVTLAGSAHAQFKNNDKLQSELALTGTLCKNLKPKLVRVQDKINRAGYVLNLTRRISKVADKIDKRLKANIDALFPLTLIPKVKEIAKPIRTVLRVIRKKLKPINDTMKKADKVIAKYRNFLSKISNAIRLSKKGFNGTCSTAAIYLKANIKVEKCVRGLEEGSLKKKLTNKLEGQAKSIQPIIAVINRILKTIDDASNVTENTVKTAAAFYPDLKKFGPTFQKFEVLINYTHKPIALLNKLLKLKITIKVTKKIHIKIPKPRKPSIGDIKKVIEGFRIKTQVTKVTFTIRQILNGIEGPFKRLEKKFMDLVMKKLGPVSVQLRKLKAGFNGIKIPILSGLAAKFTKIKIEIAKIKAPALWAKLLKIQQGFELPLRSFTGMLATIKCKGCRGSSYLTTAGTCKDCTGNTYAGYRATRCRPCPKGTYHVNHYRCIKKVTNCLTHPKLGSQIKNMIRSFQHILRQRCGYVFFGVYKATTNKSCAARVLWQYSPIIPRNLGCRIVGGYPAFVRTVTSKHL